MKRAVVMGAIVFSTLTGSQVYADIPPFDPADRKGSPSPPKVEEQKRDAKAKTKQEKKKIEKTDKEKVKTVGLEG